MESWSETGLLNAQIDSWQEELVAWESEIARIRARQVELIRRLDRYQVDTAEGARTMGDWASAHLDVSRQTASRLTQLAHHPDPEIETAMAGGKWGLDRAAALTKLRHAGIDSDQFRVVAEEYSLGRLYGLLDRLRHTTPTNEEEVFDSRYLVIQPNLDESMYQLWGRLPGVDGRIVEKALTTRETELPVLPEGGSQGQRRADALTTICMDSLTGSSGEGEPARAVTVAEVFIDGALAAETYGETGAGIASGPRVGPNTLSEILCQGKTRVILGGGLHPIAYSDLGEAIPAAVRSYVLYRDQGQCSIEGCASRYRLQPHHIRQRAHGGNHHPDNLITVCWFHHHVAIHHMGFQVDPDSPTHRRRLIPKHNTGPPGLVDRLIDQAWSSPAN